jgi:hypothetical protein
MSGYKSPSSKFQWAIDGVNGLLRPGDARAEREDRRNQLQRLWFIRDILVSCVSYHGQSQALGCCEMVPTCMSCRG